MFSSIKWRFVSIYFILVLMVMSIVGTVIINNLRDRQIDNTTAQMYGTIESIVASSEDFSGDWRVNGAKINETIKKWRLSGNETAYLISRDDYKIISSTANTGDIMMGKNALSQRNLRPDLVLEGFHGKKADATVTNENAGSIEKHIVQPIYSPDGDINGVFYLSGSLNSVFSVVRDAKVILTYATIIALIITTFLGYLMASGITVPIRNLTQKAKLMAEGDFDQRVQVRSNDEIGRLGSMFNYLTEELKLTIEKMDLEKSKLDTIFQYMAEGIIAVDRSGKLIHANPIARSLLNLSQTDMGVEFNLENIGIENLDYNNIITLSGSEQLDLKGKFYNVVYAPFKGDNNKESGIIAVFQDITKEHNLDMMRREFVANVSHELKTPITTVKSYTETLLSTDLDRPATKRFLGIILKENERMERLVRDLLQLSKMDYGNMEYKLKSVDTYELILSSLEGVNLMIKEKGHKIELSIPENIPNIYVDYHVASQILINILSNSIKYTKEGGKIKISAKDEDGFVKIKITDNGIGIPRRDLDRIFERFYRVEKSRSRSMGGTGLGLSIAREFTRAMGGDITIESEIDIGTIATVVFKAECDEEII